MTLTFFTYLALVVLVVLVVLVNLFWNLLGDVDRKVSALDLNHISLELQGLKDSIDQIDLKSLPDELAQAADFVDKIDLEKLQKEVDDLSLVVEKYSSVISRVKKLEKCNGTRQVCAPQVCIWGNCTPSVCTDVPNCG